MQGGRQRTCLDCRMQESLLLVVVVVGGSRGLPVDVVTDEAQGLPACCDAMVSCRCQRLGGATQHSAASVC